MRSKKGKKSQKLHTPEHETTRRRRGRRDLLVEILKTAQNGARKTHIMEKAGLSYAQLKKYLRLLKEAGFLSEKQGIWKTTEKGFHAIEACKICHLLTEEVS